MNAEIERIDAFVAELGEIAKRIENAERTYGRGMLSRCRLRLLRLWCLLRAERLERKVVRNLERLETEQSAGIVR